MKLTPWYLAALAPIAVAGCSSALMGHVAVLAVAIGIFVGTLSLGKQPVSPVDAAKSVVTQLEANAAFPATFPATTLASGDKTA